MFFFSPFVCGILEPEVCHCPSDTSLTAEFTPEDQSVPIPVPAAASSLAAERSQDGDEENPLKPRESVEEEKMGLVKQEEHLKVQDQENKDRRETAAETGEVDSFSTLRRRSGWLMVPYTDLPPEEITGLCLNKQHWSPGIRSRG